MKLTNSNHPARIEWRHGAAKRIHKTVGLSLFGWFVGFLKFEDDRIAEIREPWEQTSDKSDNGEDK